MRSYYTRARAIRYNRTWRGFSQKTLTATLGALDCEALHQEQKHPLRILDIGCGTGLLLQQLGKMIPDAELYGIDASAEMLTQAHHALSSYPCVTLLQARLAKGEVSRLPYGPHFFDLITCTNTLHYLEAPIPLLQELKYMLEPDGQLVIEDYTLRGFPFLRKIIEWGIHVYDPQHVRLYTQVEMEGVCTQVGLHIAHAEAFPIDLFCDGWVLRVDMEKRVTQ